MKQVVLALLLIGSLGLCGLAEDAAAQALTKDQQKCVNGLNKDFQKVSAAAGKDIGDCIKNAAKGKLVGTIEDCSTADSKGKVQKAADKTQADYDKLCVGTDKNGDPKDPPYGATDAATANAAALKKESELIHDVFGSDLDAAVILESADKDASKCQQAVSKSVKKCQDTMLKEFNGCKKGGLKSSGGAPPVIQSAAGLEACVGADPKGKVAAACDDAGKPDKIRKDIDTKCVAKGVDLSDAFPGCATDDASALHSCLRDAASCRACIAVNTADGIAASCPGCMVSGPIHTVAPLDTASFCTGGPNEGEPCTDTLSHTDCPPGPPAVRCLSRSNFLLHTVATPPPGPPLFSITPGYDMDITCDAPDPNTGVAHCDCPITNIIPMEITIIGYVCVNPWAGCPGGFIDCDGGEVSDVETLGDHSIGNCGLADDPNETDPNNVTGPEECQTQCETYCDAQGSGYRVFEALCEGYCRAGSRHGLLCQFDVDCPDGGCVGGEPVAHNGRCQCNCIRNVGTKARPGEFVCETGVAAQTEVNAPCQSVDGINDVTVTLGAQCVPYTTSTATGHLRDADETGVNLDSSPRTGSPITCGELARGETNPMFIVGNMVFFDSSIGDLLVPIFQDFR